MRRAIYCLTPKAPPHNRNIQPSYQVQRLYHTVYFCYEKECFQIKFVSKTKEFTSQSLPGRGEDNIPSSALRKLKLPNCWEVLRSLSLFLMPILKGVKCLHLTLPSMREGAEYHTSKLVQKVYFVSPEPETLQTTNTCSFKLFPLQLFFLQLKRSWCHCQVLRAELESHSSEATALQLTDRTTQPVEDFPRPAATHRTAATVLSHVSTEAGCSQGKPPTSPRG